MDSPAPVLSAAANAAAAAVLFPAPSVHPF